MYVANSLRLQELRAHHSYQANSVSMMGRALVKKAMPIARRLEQRKASKLAERNTRGSPSGASDEGGHEGSVFSARWVPHPKSGIYFPEGHEWVMEDVPKDAARFTATWWARDQEGINPPHAANDLPPALRHSS